MAARHERIRFRKMNGYGSKGFQTSNVEFMIIQKNSAPEKMPMKRQLPPKSASLSATRSPMVRL